MLLLLKFLFSFLSKRLVSEVQHEDFVCLHSKRIWIFFSWNFQNFVSILFITVCFWNFIFLISLSHWLCVRKWLLWYFRLFRTWWKWWRRRSVWFDAQTRRLICLLLDCEIGKLLFRIKTKDLIINVVKMTC